MTVQRIVQEFLWRQGPGLAQTLTAKLGFTGLQASGFVRTLVAGASKALQAGGLDREILLGGQTEAIVGRLDVGGVAKSVGVDLRKAQAGAREVVARLAAYLEEHSSALDGLPPEVVGGKVGALSRGAGKLFGK